jgi:hypothetical protein
MWQEWIVGFMVVFATLYAFWYWMPARLRSRLGRIQKRLGEKPGCGACSSSCGGCSAAGPTSPAEGGKLGRQPIWIKPRP